MIGQRAADGRNGRGPRTAVVRATGHHDAALHRHRVAEGLIGRNDLHQPRDHLSTAAPAADHDTVLIQLAHLTRRDHLEDLGQEGLVHTAVPPPRASVPGVLCVGVLYAQQLL